MSDDQKIRYMGLDFGTAYSYMSCISPDDGEPVKLLTSKEVGYEKRGIPSFVWCSNENGKIQIKVGAEAERALWNDPGNVVSSIKMKLTQKEPFILNGRSFSAREIAGHLISYIFEKSREAADEKYFEMSPKDIKIVMGVPIRFGDEEREILTSLIREQGFVDVELIPEPVAAALNHVKKEGKSCSEVLVCDVGAGTFDIAFLTRNLVRTPEYPYPYKEAASDGGFLAGNAIDEAFADYIIGKFGSQWSPELIARVKDKNDHERSRFIKQVREFKERISTEKFTEGALCIGNSYEGVSLSLEELENAAEGITSVIAGKCYEVVKKCGRLDGDFPIVLVGGSSNSPIIANAIAKKFPKQAQMKRIFVREPSTAIMNGCTFYAQSKEISSWVNFAYAIECYDEEAGRQVLNVEIPAGVQLPYSIESHFSTRHDNQNSVEFRIYEVPNITEDDDYIVNVEDGVYKDIKIVHSFRRPVPRGTHVTCRMELTQSGILKVSVWDDGITGGTTVKEYGTGLGKVLGKKAPQDGVQK